MSRLSGEPCTRPSLTVVDGGKRRPVVVGHITPGQRAVARLCSWCSEWKTDADEAAHEKGAPISHGICAECKAKLLAPFNGDAA